MRAEFPVEHAIKAWPLVKRICEEGREFESNGHKIRLGHFQIDKIDSDGVIYAGCHKVRFAEVQRFMQSIC
jgi:hypothetical protein